MEELNINLKLGRKSRYLEVKKFLKYRARRNKITETKPIELVERFNISLSSARNYLFKFLAEEVKIDVEKLPKFYKN